MAIQFIFGGATARGVAKGGAVVARGLGKSVGGSGNTGFFSTGGSQVGKLFGGQVVSLNKQSVIDALGKKNVRVFKRLGAWCMTVMRRSMRPGGKKGKSSNPGEPPRYHKKTVRNRIFYGLRPNLKVLVVGPELFRQASRRRARLRGVKTVPELLDLGGGVTLSRDEVIPAGMNSGGRGTVIPAGTRQRYLPRPFVDPVQEAGNKKWKELLATTPMR